MDSHSAVEMDAAEIDAFLGTGGTCVAAFARDDEPYAVPLSYGYDAESGQFYVRIGSAEGSEKASFVGPNRQVSLVVTGETDDGWKSVVARGRLREVTEAGVDSEVVDAIRRMDIPFVTIYDVPARELDFQLYRLTSESLTGRKER